MSSKITSDRDSVTPTSSSDESSDISSVTKHTKSSKRLSSAGKTSVDYHSGSIVKRDTTTKNAADKESVGKGGITRRDSEVFNATELRLNALAGVVTGKQVADYEVGEVVFVNHEGVPWPARIEEPSYISEVVTRFEFAVFLYGLHIRKRVRLKDMFLYEQNLQAFGGKSSNRILNIALYEVQTNPDCNLKKIPSHMKAPIRYLMKSRSHTALERYLEGPALELEVTEGDELQSTGDSLDYNPFQSDTLVSYDTALGYFTIISSFLFMAYLTWWILIMPFLEPSYFSLLEDYFPNPSHSLIYPITGGTILACSIIAFFGAMMYGPRVHARQHLLVLPQDRRDAPMRYEKVQNFLEAIRKSQPAIFILLLSAMFLLTPFKFFALFIISLGGFHMVYDFVLYL